MKFANFTPHGLVFCTKCEPVETDKPGPQVYCDECGDLCRTGREDVAACQRFLLLTHKYNFYTSTRLAQTGGMCVAVELRVNGYILLATDDETEEGMVTIGLYCEEHFEGGGGDICMWEEVDPEHGAHLWVEFEKAVGGGRPDSVFLGEE